MAKEIDKDLEFLKRVDKEQLAIFTDIMIKKGDLTQFITVSDEYKKYGKDYHKYVDVIANEFLDFGSNTFGFQKEYKEILCNVCKKMKVNFNEDQSVELIEERLLEKVLADLWEKMSDAEKQELLNEANDKFGSIDLKAVGSNILLYALRAGGFATYKIMLIIVNLLAKAILGRGLSLGANAMLARLLGVALGPIGMLLSGIWLIKDIGGPAYRVVIPCTILIACMRKQDKLSEYKGKAWD